MMETLLIMLVQLIVSILLGIVRLTWKLAFLLGRLLAVLLPVAFRGMRALISAIIRRLSQERQEKIGPRYIDVTAYTRHPDRPRGGSESGASLSYRRRHTVRNYWRSGGK
jgi:hypothetical protein